MLSFSGLRVQDTWKDALSHVNADPRIGKEAAEVPAIAGGTLNRKIDLNCSIELFGPLAERKLRVEERISFAARDVPVLLYISGEETAGRESRIHFGLQDHKREVLSRES
jgi:hypothetical protein